MLAIVIAAGEVVSAQQVPTPPGAVGGVFGGRRPPDPNRSSTRWAVTFNASGGVDVEPVESDPVVPDPDAPDSPVGSAGTASFESQFVRGRTGRLVEITAGGFVNHQELQTEQMHGASGGVRGQFDPSSRLGFGGAINVSYQPVSVIAPVGLPGAGGGEGAEPPSNLGPPPGIEEERWLSTIATATVTRGWTPRQRLELSFTDFRSTPINSAGLESRTRMASAREVWNATQHTELRVSYNYDETTQTGELGIGAPTTIQSLDAGFNFERSLGGRTLAFILDAGADLADALTAPGVTERSIMPSGSLTIQYEVGGNWSLSAGYSHEATVLTGVSPQPFTTDQASVQLGGTVAGRVGISIFGAYTQGIALEGQPGSYKAGTGTAQVNYGIGRCCSLFGTVSYYDHRLLDVSPAPIGFPGTYGRHTVRVGFSYWLPLYGTF